MLDHADAGDCVKVPARRIAVVGDADLNQVVQSGVADALAGEPGLGRRQRDSQDLDPMPDGGVDRKAPPAAADVEDPLAGAEVELATDQLELLLLGGLERCRATGEDPAAVGHRAIEEEREELVRYVVVVTDGG